jgi:glutamate dehydrogenase (NADP+)
MPTTSSSRLTTTASNSITDKMNNPQDNGFEFLHDLRKKYEHQPVFLQSVKEIALSLGPLFEDPENGEFYMRAFTAMTEPERTISFRVPWEDDEGNMRFNRGWRVEFSR